MGLLTPKGPPGLLRNRSVLKIKPAKSRLPPAAAAATPPGTPLHWFDLTDTSSLYIDAGSTNVTADAEEVVYVANKGSSTEAMDTISDAAPEWDTGAPAGGTQSGALHFTSASSEGLTMSAADTISTEGFSMCVVFAVETSQVHGYMDMDSTDALFYSNPSTEVFQNYVSAGETLTAAGADPTTLDKWHAAYATHDDEASPTSSLTLDLDWDEGGTPTTGTHALGTNPANPANMFIGRYAGGNWVNGWIGECIWWPTALSTAETEELETYLSTKYGVVWAA